MDRGRSPLHGGIEPASSPRLDYRAGACLALVGFAVFCSFVAAPRSNAGGDPDRTPDLPYATRGPRQIAFTPDARQALVTEADEGTLAVIDAASHQVIRRMATGGEMPTGVAAGAGFAVVANTFSGTLALLDLQTGRALRKQPLVGEPWAVALSRDGRSAFVSVSQLDQVAVLALPSLRVRARIRVGRRPRAMALSPDGKELVVANFQEGSISLVDTASGRETRRLPLPGVNLRGVCLSPDGRRALVTGQIPAPDRRTLDALRVWSNALFVVDLRDSTRSVTTIPLDRSAAAPDPDGIAALDPDHVVISIAGADRVLRAALPQPASGSSADSAGASLLAPASGTGDGSETASSTGARPRGITLSPDGGSLWVANELGGSVSVFDSRSLRPIREIPLGVPRRRELRLEGRYLFGSARLTRGGRFTCSSCHPEGGSDGRVWEFVHVPDGLIRRNSRALRGGITLTAPFRWSGFERDIEQFTQDEITGLMHGPKQGHEVLHALWNMLDQFPMPPNPFRAPGGTLAPTARAGKALFFGSAGCAACHSGEMAGGTGKKAWVGTTDTRLTLDVPHLVGAYDSPPYLHDGRAATLEAIFTSHNAAHRHGNAHLLSKRERAEVLEYVREL